MPPADVVPLSSFRTDVSILAVVMSRRSVFAKSRAAVESHALTARHRYVDCRAWYEGQPARRRWSTSAVAALGVFGAFGILVASNLGATTPPAGAAAKAPGGTGDCTSLPTCYTPQQLEVAYGVQPLLQRGIDGRGETVVLPELAESQLSPPLVTDLRRTLLPSTACSTCRRRASRW